MNNGIRTESAHYCQWYNEPPVYERCPYLVKNNHCNLYDKSLEYGYATDSWTGRDSLYVERCENCIEFERKETIK